MSPPNTPDVVGTRVLRTQVRHSKLPAASLIRQAAARGAERGIARLEAERPSAPTAVPMCGGRAARRHEVTITGAMFLRLRCLLLFQPKALVFRVRCEKARNERETMQRGLLFAPFHCARISESFLRPRVPRNAEPYLLHFYSRTASWARCTVAPSIRLTPVPAFRRFRPRGRGSGRLRGTEDSAPPPTPSCTARPLFLNQGELSDFLARLAAFHASACRMYKSQAQTVKPDGLSNRTEN